MFSDRLLNVICCPACKSDLAADGERALICSSCGKKYEVVQNIPILLCSQGDDVGEVVKNFYEEAWKKDETGTLVAKSIHEELNDLDQRYIKVNEDRFAETFSEGGRYFLDVGCGGQPRGAFGKSQDYHVCVDLTLQGLLECRRRLGDRAICVLGSMLDLPIKSESCDGVMASHCLYHIDKDLQAKALSELSRAAKRGGKVAIFYGNPASIEARVVSLAQKTVRPLMFWRNVGQKVGQGGGYYSPKPGLTLYYHAFSVKKMTNMLNAASPKDSKISVFPLRLFTRRLSTPVFSKAIFGQLAFRLFTALERNFPGRLMVDMSSYVCYILMKRE